RARAYQKPTDPILTMQRLVSLKMKSGSCLATFIETFDKYKREYERNSGPLPPSYCTSLLITMLAAPHREAALGIRRSNTSLSYEDLTKELLSEEALRSVKEVSTPSEALPKIPLTEISANFRPNSKNRAGQQQRRGNRSERRVRCIRCMDKDPNCSGTAKTCPARMPQDKSDRCNRCNRPKKFCPSTSTCTQRDVVRCE
ncbi:hypothetical protein Pmar_PMAR001308, partial [Perkinsus marinus ATCC 50983]